jgi:hypothetical protein
MTPKQKLIKEVDQYINDLEDSNIMKDQYIEDFNESVKQKNCNYLIRLVSCIYVDGGRDKNLLTILGGLYLLKEIFELEIVQEETQRRKSNEQHKFNW